MELPVWMQKVKKALGLNSLVVKLAVKGSLPPTIALAAYQATPWANEYNTIGYLVAIMCILSLPIQTRAKFMQHIFMCTFFTCLGAAASCLSLVCIIKTRQHTTHSAPTITTGQTGGPEVVEFNGSASAVAGVFIVIYVYFSNLVRAYRPALMVPTVQFAIFTMVSSVYGPLFPDMTAAEAFVKRMLICFLTGFGLSTGVSLFVFPITSRGLAKKQMAGVFGLMKQIIATHQSFMGAVLAKDEDGYRDDKKVSAQAKKMQGLVVGLQGLFARLKMEISFARKEFAIGKLDANDFTVMQHKLRDIMMPMVGLSTFLGFTQSAEEASLDALADGDGEELMAAMKRLKPGDWQEIFELSAEPYAELKSVLDSALTHVSYILGICKKPKEKGADEEAKATAPPSPGDVDFAKYLAAQIEDYHDHRQTVIQRWGEQKGIVLPAAFWHDHEDSYKARKRATMAIKSKNLQQQLYLQLFAEFVIFSMADAVLQMVLWADAKKANGELKLRFINPGWRRVRKLIYGSWWQDNMPHLHNSSRNSMNGMWIGDALRKRKDPEHLEPTTVYERITNSFRAIPRVLSSEQSGYAARAALCVISIAIIGFIRQSWQFFLEQRGIWSLIMACLSMGANTSVGLFGMFLRIAGSLVGMVAVIAVWYIGDGRPAAILPVMWVWFLIPWWFTVTQARFMMSGLIVSITTALLIGYELQAVKFGPQVEQDENHQLWYPIYILAPMRVVSVLVGLAAAVFWTYFPYPISTRTKLREDLGESLQLLANFYSVVHTLIDVRIHQGVGPSDDKDSPIARVEKARQEVVQNCVVVLGRLRTHLVDVKLEPTFGGRFPVEKYQKLIDSIQRIFQDLYLISYATDSFVNSEVEDSEWIEDFREFTADVSITSHKFTSILCQLSASVRNAHPLPPYMRVPRPEPMNERMAELDPDILSLDHINEPSYTAFAALTVTSSIVSDELNRIVRMVKDLVGEVDFSYQIAKPEPRRNTRTSRALARATRWFGPPR